MHGLPNHDQGRHIDWGKTSADYAVYRPGYPASFFRKLTALDIGLRGQRILDLGTSTGGLARQFATQGRRVIGADIAGIGTERFDPEHAGDYRHYEKAATV